MLLHWSILQNRANLANYRIPLFETELCAEFKAPRWINARLLREADLILRKAIDICRTSKISKAQLRNLDTIQESTVNSIKSSKQRRTFSKQNAREEVAQQSKNERKKCSRCCYNEHEMRNCPAYGQTCNKSQERNHFAKVCRSVIKPIHAVEEDSDSQDDCSDSYIPFTSQRKTYLTMNGTLKLKWARKWALKLDTGAQCNVMSRELNHQMTKENFANQEQNWSLILSTTSKLVEKTFS